MLQRAYRLLALAFSRFQADKSKRFGGPSGCSAHALEAMRVLWVSSQVVILMVLKSTGLCTTKVPAIVWSSACYCASIRDPRP